MAQQQKNNLITLRNDLPADKQKVRAVLADWGVSRDSISRLLADKRIEVAPLRRPADERTSAGATRSH